jgi:hypothetical protein
MIKLISSKLKGKLEKLDHLLILKGKLIIKIVLEKK